MAARNNVQQVQLVLATLRQQHSYPNSVEEPDLVDVNINCSETLTNSTTESEGTSQAVEQILLCPDQAIDGPMEFDVEIFIDLMKEEPCLWNTSCRAYKENTKRRNAWAKITEVF